MKRGGLQRPRRRRCRSLLRWCRQRRAPPGSRRRRWQRGRLMPGCHRGRARGWQKWHRHGFRHRRRDGRLLRTGRCERIHRYLCCRPIVRFLALVPCGSPSRGMLSIESWPSNNKPAEPGSKKDVRTHILQCLKIPIPLQSWK